MKLNPRDSFSVLEPATQGQTLIERAIDVHVVDGEEMMARWFYSPNDCDLMVWYRSNGELAKFQLNAAGQITDWCEADGLKTGLIVEIEFAATSEHFAETIQFDFEIDREAVRCATRLISNTTALSPTTKGSILDILTRPWPSDRRQSANSTRDRFWSRFKRWTTGT